MTDAGGSSTFRRNVKWQLVGSAGQALLGGLMLLLVGRELKATGFGEFSIVMGFVYVANLLLEPRMQDVAAKQFWNTATAESMQGSQHHVLDLLLVELVGKILPCLALIVLSGLLARTGQLPSDGRMLIVVAAIGIYLSRLGNGLSVGLLRVLGRSDLYAACATGELVLRLVLTLLFIHLFDLTVLWTILLLSISGFISNAVQWWLTVGQLHGIADSARAWKWREARGRLRSNRRLILSNLGLSASDLMSKDLDITLISPLMPAEQIGIYKMAKNLTQLTWRAVDPFYLALMPEVNRLVSSRRFADLRRLIVKSATGLFALAVLLSAATYGLTSLFGTTVLGPAYASVPTLMPLMLIGIILSAPLVWGHPLSVALNRAEVAFAGSLLGSVVGLFAFLLLTPHHGLHGAGLAWTATFVANFVFTAAVAQVLLAKSVGALHGH